MINITWNRHDTLPEIEVKIEGYGLVDDLPGIASEILSLYAKLKNENHHLPLDYQKRLEELGHYHE